MLAAAAPTLYVLHAGLVLSACISALFKVYVSFQLVRLASYGVCDCLLLLSSGSVPCMSSRCATSYHTICRQLSSILLRRLSVMTPSQICTILHLAKLPQYCTTYVSYAIVREVDYQQSLCAWCCCPQSRMALPFVLPWFEALVDGSTPPEAVPVLPRAAREGALSSLSTLSPTNLLQHQVPLPTHVIVGRCRTRRLFGWLQWVVQLW